MNVDALFKSMDLDSNGTISYEEFRTTAYYRTALQSAERIDNVFAVFDADGDGFIDMNELKAVF
jgi:calcium-dependent protein kinase